MSDACLPDGRGVRDFTGPRWPKVVPVELPPDVVAVIRRGRDFRRYALLAHACADYAANTPEEHRLGFRWWMIFGCTPSQRAFLESVGG